MHIVLQFLFDWKLVARLRQEVLALSERVEQQGNLIRSLSDSNEALLLQCEEQNLLLGQLVYDDPDFDGAQDVLAAIKHVRQCGAEIARATLAQQDGRLEGGEHYWGSAITLSAERPLFFFGGLQNGELV